MAAGRHNLTRRALLGASAALPVAFAAPGGASVSTDPFGLSLSKSSTSSLSPEREALRQAQGERGEGAATLRRRWSGTLAAYRRAEARVAGFKAGEALLPAERRAWPACRDLEERFGALDSLRFAALRRLLRLPAPDLPALALKLDLAVADSAWELTGCETCFEAIAADARRLARGG
ncbi:MAG: hypothetical protein QOJ94_1130 [Sphingomonadales bacterium]|jgi:hypothetical protein|nr:hypothetical protein [Sphingomonadales bacterium]